MVQRKYLGRKLSANIKIQNLPVYFSSTRFKIDNKLCFGTKQQIMELIFTRNNIHFQFQLYFKVIRPINGDSSIWRGGARCLCPQKGKMVVAILQVKALYCNSHISIMMSQSGLFGASPQKHRTWGIPTMKSAINRISSLRSEMAPNINSSLTLRELVLKKDNILKLGENFFTFQEILLLS